jgi:hypothetical protein
MLTKVDIVMVQLYRYKDSIFRSFVYKDSIFRSVAYKDYIFRLIAHISGHIDVRRYDNVYVYLKNEWKLYLRIHLVSFVLMLT